MDRKCLLCERPLSKLNELPADICLSCRESKKLTTVWFRFHDDGSVSLSEDERTDDTDKVSVKVVEAKMTRYFYAKLCDLVTVSLNDAGLMDDWYELVLVAIPNVVAETLKSEG